MPLGWLALWAGTAWLASAMGMAYLAFSSDPAFESISESPAPWSATLITAALVACGLAARWRARVEPALRHVLIAGALLAAASAGAHLTYVHVLSSDLPPGAAVSPGDEAPDFRVARPDGSSFRLSDLRGTRVLLVFHRGFW